MDKPISSLMKKQVITVNTEDTVESVTQLLASKRLSCVPVVDSKGKCFGIISAADLVRFHSLRKNPRIEKAWEVCSPKIIHVTPERTVQEVVELLIKNKIHHVFIIENDIIRGIVSMTDLIGTYLLNQPATNP